MLRVLNSLASRVDPSAHPLLDERNDAARRRQGAADRHHRRPRPVRQLQHQRRSRRRRRSSPRTPSAQVALGLVGRRGRDYFARRGFEVRYEQVNLFASLTVRRRAGDRATPAIEEFISGEVDSVYLVYNEFKSVMQQRVVVEQLLPIPRRRRSRPAGRGAAARRRSTTSTSRRRRSCSRRCSRATSRCRCSARCSSRTPRSTPRR